MNMDTLSPGLALEIFVNPFGLLILVGHDTPGSFKFIITRDLAEQFRALVISEPVYATEAAAIKAVEELLETVSQGVRSGILGGTQEAPPGIMIGRMIDDSKVFTSGHVGRIIKALGKIKFVHTNKLDDVAE